MHQLEIIRTDDAYEAALSEVGLLMESDPDPETPDGKKLELLVHLVSDFEDRNTTLPKSDPVEAIVFRMDQMGLKQSDLVPYIGSRSKVSEILSRKRQLTLSMIQALNAGLGIPAEVLIQPGSPNTDVDQVDWTRFPGKEMCARGWIRANYKDVKDSIQEHIQGFFGSVGGLESVSALNRSSKHFRSGREMNRYALTAWTTRIIKLALEDPPERKYLKGSLDMEVMRKVVELSVLPDGPIRAKAALKELGISLVFEPALPQTYLDGSAILTFIDHPIVGLTLRYDRLDNFWFSLMHELSHISLHIDKGTNQFFDDLDIKKNEDPLEEEADENAGEALIPSDKWAASPARVFPSKNSILRFARQINVHPAIVAGRVRKESNSYHIYNDLVGHGRVRYLFGLATEEE